MCVARLYSPAQCLCLPALRLPRAAIRCCYAKTAAAHAAAVLLLKGGGGGGGGRPGCAVLSRLAALLLLLLRAGVAALGQLLPEGRHRFVIREIVRIVRVVLSLNTATKEYGTADW